MRLSNPFLHRSIKSSQVFIKVSKHNWKQCEIHQVFLLLSSLIAEIGLLVMAFCASNEDKEGWAVHFSTKRCLTEFLPVVVSNIPVISLVVFWSSCLMDYAYKICKNSKNKQKKRFQFACTYLSRFTFSKYSDSMTRREILIQCKFKLAKFYEISRFSPAVIKEEENLLCFSW